MYRMDHAYKRHRYWMKAPPLERLPSEYFAEHIYVDVPGRLGGVQDQGPVQRAPPDVGQRLPALGFHLAELPGGARPSTPRALTEQERNWICHDNVAELYGLTVN